MRLLAGALHLLGYDVRVDQDVDYGNSLNCFMRSLTQARHVLLIVDENYVERADHVPTSGVHTENALLQQVYAERPEGWLAVIAVDNPMFSLPEWLQEHNPRAFNFNDSAFPGDAPGSDQLDDLWRWLEGLPPDKTNAVSLKQQVMRAARLERITNLSDPGRSRTPALEGVVTFPFEHSASNVYTVGHGEYEFRVMFTAAGDNRVYVYRDEVRAVGILPAFEVGEDDLEPRLTPGRHVTPSVGEGAVLMNGHGMLCTIRILEVQTEGNTVERYVQPHVKFSFVVHRDS